MSVFHEPMPWDGGLSLNFVHRRIIGAAKGFLGGGLVGAGVGFVTSGSEPPQGSDPIPGLTTRGLQGVSGAERCRQQGMVINAAGRCVRSIGGISVDPRAALPGGDPFLERTSRVPVPMIGEVATSPFRETQTVRRCGRGRVLAIDGLCYAPKDLRKDQRMWPPGRKPLLTGGDLNAISRAARAAGRMKTQQKRLQKLGLLPKPKPAQRRLKSGPVEHHHHD